MDVSIDAGRQSVCIEPDYPKTPAEEMKGLFMTGEAQARMAADTGREGKSGALAASRRWRPGCSQD
jgi:hypothetical protein